MIDGFSSFSFKYKIHISVTKLEMNISSIRMWLFFLLSPLILRDVYSQRILLDSKVFWLFIVKFQLILLFSWIRRCFCLSMETLSFQISRLSETKSGALTILDVSKLDDDMILNLSGWGSLFWINVQEVNMSVKRELIMKCFFRNIYQSF